MSEKSESPHFFGGVKAIIANVKAERDKLRESLALKLRELNEIADAKWAEFEKITRSVSVDDAARLLLDATTNRLKKHLTEKNALIAGAASLSYFGDFTRPVSHGDGYAIVFEEKKKQLPPDLLGSGANAYDLLALCPEVFLPAIEANIRRILKESGSPEKGLSPSELMDRASAILEELRIIDAQRVQLRDEFKLNEFDLLPTPVRKEIDSRLGFNEQAQEPQN